MVDRNLHQLCLLSEGTSDFTDVNSDLNMCKNIGNGTNYEQVKKHSLDLIRELLAENVLNMILGLHSGVVVIIVASKQDGSWVESQLRLSCVEFRCSPLACRMSLWVHWFPPTVHTCI